MPPGLATSTDGGMSRHVRWPARVSRAVRVRRSWGAAPGPTRGHRGRGRYPELRLGGRCGGRARCAGLTLPLARWPRGGGQVWIWRGSWLPVPRVRSFLSVDSPRMWNSPPRSMSARRFRASARALFAPGAREGGLASPGSPHCRAGACHLRRGRPRWGEPCTKDESSRQARNSQRSERCCRVKC